MIIERACWFRQRTAAQKCARQCNFWRCPPESVAAADDVSISIRQGHELSTNAMWHVNSDCRHPDRTVYFRDRGLKQQRRLCANQYRIAGTPARITSTSSSRHYRPWIENARQRSPAWTFRLQTARLSRRQSVSGISRLSPHRSRRSV